MVGLYEGSQMPRHLISDAHEWINIAVRKSHEAASRTALILMASRAASATARGLLRGDTPGCWEVLQRHGRQAFRGSSPAFSTCMMYGQ